MKRIRRTLPKRKTTASTLHALRVENRTIKAEYDLMKEALERENERRIVAERLMERQLQVTSDDQFTWTTRDGERLKPADFDESHLINTVFYLQRNLVYNFGNVRYLSTLTDKVRALYELLKEAKRRDINV